MCHWDGDVEDLSLQDLKKAMSRKCLREAVQEKPRSIGKRRVTVANDSRLSLASVLSPSKGSRNESRTAAHKSLKKEASKGDSESEYEQESSQESSDSDFEDSSEKASVRRKTNRKSASSSSDEEDDEDGDDIDEIAPLPPKFVPATWDETSPVSLDVVTLYLQKK